MVKCQRIPQQCKPDYLVFKSKKGSEFELFYSNTYSVSFDASSFVANNPDTYPSGIYLISSLSEEWNLRTCSDLCVGPNEKDFLNESCILQYDLHCRLVGFVNVSIVISLATINEGNNRFNIQREVETITIKVPYTCNEF